MDGKYSIRFEMRAGDCGSDDCPRGNFKGAYGRSEMYIPGEENSLDPKYYHDLGEHWYAWSMYIPEETSHIRPAYTTLGQFKEHSKFYKKRDKKTKCDSAGMPLWFNLEREGLGLAKAKCIIKNDKPIFIITHADEVIIIPNAELKNKWLDFLLHVNWSYEDDGFMHLWVNDKKVHVVKKGITRDFPFKVKGKLPGVSFRFGIYNGKIDKYEKRLGKKRPTQVVYYDSIKRGTTCQDTALWHDCNNLPKDAQKKPDWSKCDKTEFAGAADFIPLFCYGSDGKIIPKSERISN